MADVLDLQKFVNGLNERQAHNLLVEIDKKFSLGCFLETHESAYKAWPCPICEEKRYKEEGWEGIRCI